MTFKEFYEIVMLDLDESLSDTEILDKVKGFVNRGYKELSKRERLSKVLTLNASNGKVKLPSDCYRLNFVTADNEVIGYDIEGKFIVVDYDVVTLDYCYIPDNLELDDDEVETNSSYDEFIINYAKMLYFNSESMYQDAKVFKEECNSIRITPKARTPHKTIDAIGVI